MAVENIPTALTALPQWVLWKHVVKNDRPTKIPYQVNGSEAKSNDSATWERFDHAWDRYEEGGYQGMGFVFSSEDMFCGVDLDGCRDPQTGEIAAWAQEIIDRFDTYSEVSPSKTGVKLFLIGDWLFDKGKHLVLKGVSGTGGKTAAIEVYDHGRYFAATGWRLHGWPSEPQERQAALQWLKDKFWGVAPTIETDSNYGDGSVLERARCYLAKMPPAISGQGGHNTTFRAACILVCGFGLSRKGAMTLLREWNRGCRPPWPDRDLEHKLDGAEQQSGPHGYLRDVRPERWGEVAIPSYTAPEIMESEPRIISMADVHPKPVDWLWKGRIPCGKLVNVAGPPGLGKTLVLLDIAARVTAGMGWPDGYPGGEPGGVIICSAEDDPADTLRPRLDAAGADVRRVNLIQSVTHVDVRTKKRSERMLNLQQDLDAIEKAIDRTDNCRLLILDPVNAYLGKTDSHKDAEVRGVLGPATELCQRRGVAFIYLSHLNKSQHATAQQRVSGSGAFVAAARVAYIVLADREEPTLRLLLPTKNNLAPDMGGLSFRVATNEQGLPYVAWNNLPVTISADEAMATEGRTKKDSRRRLEETQDWLAGQLMDGPRLGTELEEEARAAGISHRRLWEAKKALGVQSRKIWGSGKSSGWEWWLGTASSDPGDQAMEWQP